MSQKRDNAGMLIKLLIQKRMNLYLLILATISMLSCNKPEPETYLIPQGFTGRVNVIFNRKDGAAPRYENGRRIYEIPSNGILLTQFKDEYGIVDHRYFYVDSNGKRTSLKIYQYDYNKDGTTKWKIKDSSQAGIFLDGTTGQYGIPPNAVWWQEFVVCSYNSMDSFFTPEYKKQFENNLRKATGIIDLIIP
jgi:hypothetical protein